VTRGDRFIHVDGFGSFVVRGIERQTRGFAQGKFAAAQVCSGADSAHGTAAFFDLGRSAAQIVIEARRWRATRRRAHCFDRSRETHGFAGRRGAHCSNRLRGVHRCAAVLGARCRTAPLGAHCFAGLRGAHCFDRRNSIGVMTFRRGYGCGTFGQGASSLPDAN
jgi:hypothetical protein